MGMNTHEANMPENDLVMDVLPTTDGHFALVVEGAAGRKTGYAFIGNGYSHGIEYFDKYSDGDTVIECSKDHPLAIPVADAYWRFQATCEDEYIEHLEEMDSLEQEEGGYAFQSWM